MAYNPYAAYREQTVSQYTQSELLDLLYDGLLLNLNKAKIAIDNKNIEEANTMLQKSQKINLYLNSTLNKKFAISDDLAKLYTYFYEQINNANMKKEVQYIDNILPMIQELKDSFHEAGKVARR